MDGLARFGIQPAAICITFVAFWLSSFLPCNLQVIQSHTRYPQMVVPRTFFLRGIDIWVWCFLGLAGFVLMHYNRSKSEPTPEPDCPVPTHTQRGKLCSNYQLNCANSYSWIVHLPYNWWNATSNIYCFVFITWSYSLQLARHCIRTFEQHISWCVGHFITRRCSRPNPCTMHQVEMDRNCVLVFHSAAFCVASKGNNHRKQIIPAFVSPFWLCEAGKWGK